MVTYGAVARAGKQLSSCQADGSQENRPGEQAPAPHRASAREVTAGLTPRTSWGWGTEGHSHVPSAFTGGVAGGSQQGILHTEELLEVTAKTH